MVGWAGHPVMDPAPENEEHPACKHCTCSQKGGVTLQLAQALLKHARTKCIQCHINAHGPLYVRAVVPNYARCDFELGRYSAWYVGHVEEEYLDDEQINSYVEEFDGDLHHGLEEFMSFLEGKGYIVLNSGGGEGFTILRVPGEE